MTDEQKSDAILSALPWRCFQCDFITSDREEALAHFGDCDDGEEFKPICKWWAEMDDGERKRTFQDLQRDFGRGAKENMRLLDKIEGLECNLEALTSVIRGYKPFRKCSSIYDVFCLFDSMEGRALAAEERLAELQKQHDSEPRESCI